MAYKGRLKSIIDVAREEPDGDFNIFYNSGEGTEFSETQKKIRKEIRNLVLDPYAHTLFQLEDLNFDDDFINERPILSGGFNFFKMLCMIEWSTFEVQNQHEFLDRLNKTLNQSEAWKYAFSFYGITPDWFFSSDPNQESIKLYRIGTTSLIFLLQGLKTGFAETTEEHKIAKCIKPRYSENETIRSELSHYFTEKAFSAKHTVKGKVIGSIALMEFVSGETHQERYLKTENSQGEARERQKKSKHDLERLRQDIRQLGKALRSNAISGVTHLDLHPDNILYDKDDEVVLIDFGFNFLLGEKVGSTSQFQYASIFQAPELSELYAKTKGKITGDDFIYDRVMADIYSFAMVLFVSLTGHRMRPHEFSNVFEDLRKDYPYIGDFLDSCFSPEPSQRVALYRESLDEKDSNNKEVIGRVYDHLLEDLNERLDVYVKGSRNISKPENFLHFLMSASDVLIEDIRARRIFQKGNWDGIGHLDKKINYSCLAQTAHLVIVASAIWKLISIGWNPYELIESLPGLIICCSFSHIATRYYVNVFAQVSAVGLSRITERVLRFNSYCFFVAIAPTLYINPNLWPFCSALGLFFVGLNNYMNANLAKRLIDLYGEDMPQYFSKTKAILVNEFSGWYRWIFIYVIAFTVIGIGLHGEALTNGYFVLTDEWAFALIAIAVNLKMYFNNCSFLAFPVGGGLKRVYNWSRGLRLTPQVNKSEASVGGLGGVLFDVIYYSLTVLAGLILLGWAITNPTFESLGSLLLPTVGALAVLRTRFGPNRE